VAPNNPNYGTASTLSVKDASNADYDRKSYLKFDISGVGSVSSAKLRVYGKNSENSNNVEVKCFGADSDSWTESGITWNNAPARHSTEQSTVNVNGTWCGALGGLRCEIDSPSSAYPWDGGGNLRHQQ
jgi:hypothetical protein